MERAVRIRRCAYDEPLWNGPDAPRDSGAFYFFRAAGISLCFRVTDVSAHIAMLERLETWYAPLLGHPSFRAAVAHLYNHRCSVWLPDRMGDALYIELPAAEQIAPADNAL